MSRYLDEELKRAEQRRKLCKKQYEDYVDDEYNCAEMKFMYGIKSIEDKSNDPPSFCTLNDFVIYYNRDTKQYYADIDLPLTLSIEDKPKYVRTICNKLYNFIKMNNYEMGLDELLDNSLFIQLMSDNYKSLLNYSYIILKGMCD